MDDLEKYTQLQRKVEESQRTKDKAEGAFEEAIENLKAEFGVKNMEEAKLALKKLKQRKQDVEEEFEQAVTQFEKDWKE